MRKKRKKMIALRTHVLVAVSFFLYFSFLIVHRIKFY